MFATREGTVLYVRPPDLTALCTMQRCVLLIPPRKYHWSCFMVYVLVPGAQRRSLIPQS